MPANRVGVRPACPRWRPVVALLVAAAVSGGCAESGSQRGSQVLARVNDTELTLHQVNAKMGEQRVAVDDEARIRASRDALEALIDEELAVQAAERAQLDRDPAVRTALDAARRAVLARAYLARAAGPRTPPPEAELRRYYDERPEFFAQRRSYRFRELALEADAALEALVRARLRDDADLEQLADWLHARGARFRAHGYAGAAELLPAGEARTLAEARPGDTRVLRDAGVLRIVQVIAIRSDPVEFAAARPLIEARLAEERARAAAEAELRRLKESARIVYAGAAAQPEGASVR